jgi:LmbE family N-acetylglucosaminyl deacetylase
MQAGRRILGVFAHPDDETFLAGGTLAKYAAAGCEVLLLCATHGEAGKRGDYEQLTPQEFARIRRKELEAAGRALGICRPLFLDCADRGLAGDCWNSATDEIARIMRRLKPDAVITFGPDGISGHPDHVALSAIVRAALESTGLPARLYYVLRSASLPQCCTAVRPVEAPPLTTVIDVSPFGERKLLAIRSYHSQKHLQPRDSAAVEAVRKGSENFHRAAPACAQSLPEIDVEDSTEGVTMLAAVPLEEDQFALRNILDGQPWNLQFARSWSEVQAVLRLDSVAVVLTDVRHPGGRSWKDLLNEMEGMVNPPALIVTDRLADNLLWAEVLNLGGHDVLMKPFDATEVLRVVESAVRSWRRGAKSVSSAGARR